MKPETAAAIETIPGLEPLPDKLGNRQSVVRVTDGVVERLDGKPLTKAQQAALAVLLAP